MNLQQTVSILLRKKFQRIMLNFVKTQFGLLTSYLRSTYKTIYCGIKNGSMSNPRAANLKKFINQFKIYIMIFVMMKMTQSLLKTLL
jgi:hypothetical protein